MEYSLDLNKTPALRFLLKQSEQEAFEKLKVVHPADAFAKTAGYDSWEDVIVAADSDIIIGIMPSAGKSLISLQMLSQTIKDAGLKYSANEFGTLTVWRQV